MSTHTFSAQPNWTAPASARPSPGPEPKPRGIAAEGGDLIRMWRDCGADGRRYRRAAIGTRWLTPADDLVRELIVHTPDRRTGDTVVLSERVAALLLGRGEAVRPLRRARLLRMLDRRRHRQPDRLPAREAHWLCRRLERALGTGVAIVAHGSIVRANSPMALPAPGLSHALADEPLGSGRDATPIVLVRPAPERRGFR